MDRPLSENERATKKKELAWFERCRALCGMFPPGEPEQNASHAPEPDIIFRDISLGIEITEYLSKQEGGSSSRRSEVLRNRLLQEAKTVFERISGEQIFVSVSWAPHQKLPQKTDMALAKGIADKVISMLATGTTWWQPDWAKVEGRLLAQQLGDIWIFRLKNGAHSWTSAESGMVGNDVRRIQQTIDGKEPLIPKYRKTCKDLWLLIVAEARLSTHFSPDEDFADAVFRTSFDRVFLFDVFHNEMRDLITNAKTL